MVQKLKQLQVTGAKAKEKDYKLHDGQGLFLLVTTTGSKLWRLKYRVDRKEKLMALGRYPDMSLADARTAMAVARASLRLGNDPMVIRKHEKNSRQVAAENSFQTIATKWWQHWKSARTERHAGYVLRRLEIDVFPAIGSRPISSIEAIELVAMVKKIAERGALDIAKRVLQTTGQIFRFAIANGITPRNPVSDIKPGDVLPARKKQHFARVQIDELPGLLRSLEAYQGTPLTRLAMKLLCLTFVRTNELLNAKWKEFNLDAKRWDVPKERMKNRIPHVVPLSPQAIEVLKTLDLVSGNSELLFPGERDQSKAMSNNTILAALKRMGYQGKMTGHGFRGIASTWLHERGFDHAHIELQLSHQSRDEVSAAYNFATHLDSRSKMMLAWGSFIDHLSAGKQPHQFVT